MPNASLQEWRHQLLHKDGVNWQLNVRRRSIGPAALIPLFVLVCAQPLIAHPGSMPHISAALTAPHARPDGIDAAAVDRLIRRARETHSDALVLLKDGKTVIAWYSGQLPQPIEAMSATKSVVSLAIGHLIDDGKIKSIDEPVYRFYPEWNQGRKKRITLRHILNHTSGLQADETTDDIYPSRNFVQLALAAELVSDPGTRFFYNNKAVNLLAGIVEIASGKRLNDYVRDVIFAPLGIREFSWTLDQAGNPHAMSGLQIHAADFARIGQMMVDGGMWNGKRIISRKWIEESTRAGQPFEPSCGLLWWIQHDDAYLVVDDDAIGTWKRAGLSAAVLRKLVALKEKRIGVDEYDARVRAVLGGKKEYEAWAAAVRRTRVRAGRPEWGPTIAYSARGYLGQYRVVIPRERLVAVRQIRASSHLSDADDFGDFEEMVRELVKTYDVGKPARNITEVVTPVLSGGRREVRTTDELIWY